MNIAARENVQRNLFADPQLEYNEAVQFYQHDVEWANRLILGDSLTVMSSLAQREDLGGKVQTIYFDPPYGIKYASNFQPTVFQRNVTDRPADLTREPGTDSGISRYLAPRRAFLPRLPPRPAASCKRTAHR